MGLAGKSILVHDSELFLYYIGLICKFAMFYNTLLLHFPVSVIYTKTCRGNIQSMSVYILLVSFEDMELY